MQKIIKEIANNLDSGITSYYNPKNRKLIGIPNIDDFGIIDKDFQEFIQKDIDEITKYKEDFIAFELLKGYETFKIIEDFKHELSDTNFIEKLNYALTNKKPFRNFKYLIDNSDYREQWFKFKQQELEKIVKKIIDQA
ncbi:UPF0158 family protein [Lutibacter sp. A64]|uniref:UPF0158 family protein n=1 Tax=Lutibacter sp. A64 TaxID=2918526 RepID=UPI001F05D35D|nr:UPF0158 family protein [Lutibacter sp. A64]UMB53295.1 UPF0158 family protein [Lutibacter sp. A64]